jgi:hypothetical protein
MHHTSVVLAESSRRARECQAETSRSHDGRRAGSVVYGLQLLASTTCFAAHAPLPSWLVILPVP